MPPTRKDKLDQVLMEHVGEWMTASEILAEIGERWNLEGFSSARSLALFLKRYRFEKEGSKYLIEEEKIEQVEDDPLAI